jgi:uncharacterized protein (DUF3820 family)
MSELRDTDPIWFGEHEGTPLKDVPASYLLWWYEERFTADQLNAIWSKKETALLDYISDHLEQLEDEREEE